MKMAQASNPHYNPSNLLEVLYKVVGARNDAQLARALEVSAPVICKIRRHKMPLPPSMLIRMHEVTKISIGDLRKLAGDFRAHTGRSAHHPTATEITSMQKYSSSLGKAVAQELADRL